MTRVGIIGIGHTVFGRRSDATVQELAYEAYRDALADAKLDPEFIDASVIGSVPECRTTCLIEVRLPHPGCGSHATDPGTLRPCSACASSPNSAKPTAR